MAYRSVRRMDVPEENTMRARFHLNGDLEIWVESEPHGHGVDLSFKRGVCYQHGPGDACQEIQTETIALPKNEARAIASAMMGCAADL